MLKVFLSFDFRDGRDLPARVEMLLESHGVRPVTGEVLGGGALTSEVKSLIEGSQGLVALMTPRDRKPNGRYTTSQWVRDELNYARATQQQAIALVDRRVELEPGAFQEHERIDYNSRAPLLAFIKLSRTVGEWKRRWGRVVQVRILPEELAMRLAASNGAGSCQYRFVNAGDWKPWLDAKVVPEVGGTFAYVAGAQDDWQIQLRITIGNETWTSPATPQWMHMELSKGAVR